MNIRDEYNVPATTANDTFLGTSYTAQNAAAGDYFFIQILEDSTDIVYKTVNDKENVKPLITLNAGVFVCRCVELVSASADVLILL